MPMKDILLTFLVAMVPVVELRGAIPYGVVRGLNIWTAILASVLGNLVPLPGTGAWTGALVAAMMEMRLKRAFPAIAIGVVIAGVIVSVVTYGAQAIFSF